MAIKLIDEYPGRVASPSAEYPDGAFRNQSAPGAEDGSYPDQAWTNDLWGFTRAILELMGVEPNGTPDAANASQILDALEGRILYYMGFDPYVSFESGLNITTRQQTVIDRSDGKVYWWGGSLPHTTGSTIAGDGDWIEVRAAVTDKDVQFESVTADEFDGPRA